MCTFGLLSSMVFASTVGLLAFKDYSDRKLGLEQVNETGVVGWGEQDMLWEYSSCSPEL